MAEWRLAKSLETLRQQVNEAYPNRLKVSDGTKGDEAHASRQSDHNPNAANVVQALDITHDPRPGQGPDTWRLAEVLRLNQDPRIKYVISNGRIFSSAKAPWTWRPYGGANKHDKHIHVSVADDPALYDDDGAWNLTAPDDIGPAPQDIDALERAMARKIIDYESRREGGKLAVHRPGDGSYEIAGINSASHPAEAAALLELLNAGKHDAAEERAGEYIIRYTDPAEAWSPDRGVQFYLRDTWFNRGPGGAARILQDAVNVEIDGEVGPITRKAAEIASADPAGLLIKLRAAREAYERAPPANAGFSARDESHPAWKGLVKRWDRALKDARAFSAAVVPAPEPVPDLPPPVLPPPAAPFFDRLNELVDAIMAERQRVDESLNRMSALAAELQRHIDEVAT